MSEHKDATQPKRSDVFPPDVDPATYPYDDDDGGMGGPGCLVWGIMGIFGVLIAIGIVVLATLAGFNQGLETAQVTAVAATSQFTGRQCEIIPTDVAAGRLPLVESRYNSITVNGVVPDCAQPFIQSATQAYQQSLITPTQPATATPEATMTATSAPVVESTAEATQPADSDTAETGSNVVNGYDLDALLQEGRDFLAEGEYEDAISTFDAINAIDDTYQSSTVNSLLFNALSQRALDLYRMPGGSLAQAIILTNRAEQFGTISDDLSFERDVAQIYLDAEPNLNINYSIAINLLNQVIFLSPNYPRGTGQASQLLFEQLEGYGDQLLLGGDACGAQAQFAAALALRPQAAGLSTKNATASTQCSSGVTAATVDPNVTPPTQDPNAPVVPTATPTEGVAPIGQPGG
ncbi:MAG: hypothetical protein AAFQ07_06045 [Chloroflexota bacterium]